MPTCSMKKHNAVNIVKINECSQKNVKIQPIYQFNLDLKEKLESFNTNQKTYFK